MVAATIRSAQAVTCKLRYGTQQAEVSMKAGEAKRLNGSLAVIE